MGVYIKKFFSNSLKVKCLIAFQSQAFLSILKRFGRYEMLIFGRFDVTASHGDGNGGHGIKTLKVLYFSWYLFV